jgi:N12 class adenine-specific DNA methylase
MRITFNGKTLKLDGENYEIRLREAQQRFAFSRKFWRMGQGDWEAFLKSSRKKHNK